MLFELILFLLLGVLAGTFTGLIPGIHINLIGATLITLSSTILFSIPTIFLVVFIVSMAITHTFIDFIPSVFLGCPDTDTELSVLPGHNLLKKGQGYAAILLANYGSITSIIILIIIAYPSIILINNFYETISQAIPYLLIIVSILLIAIQKNKFESTKVFILTGILGYLVLNINMDHSLLPLLTGLFGASSITLSIKNKTIIPKQIITIPKFNKKSIIGSIIAAPICSFLPGLGSGQAAIIGSRLYKTNQQDFLSLLGATNTLVMGFSFLSLYTIGKTRTGAALAIKEILGNLPSNTLIIILSTTLIVSIIAYFLTKIISLKISKQIHRINYKNISISTLIILLIINLFVSGPMGLLILVVSTMTGIYCINLGVKRTNMMGALLIPTILLYLL